MKLNIYTYILISCAFVLRLESSDQALQEDHTEGSQEVKKDISKHIDPFLSLQIPKSKIAKGPKKIVKTEQIDQKVIKVTYSDGTIKFL